MNEWVDFVMIVLVCTNLALLGSSRLGACIRIVAVQGSVLSLLPLLVHAEGVSPRSVVLAVVTCALKGVAFPHFLRRALREANVRREVEPYVGYTLSLLAGILALLAGLWIGSRLPLPATLTSSLVVPVALATILAGLFLIVSRKKAINQVLGYLVLENGIYAFGVALAQREPLLVEMGVLLDVFVAVFVMGIAMFHINRAFDDIDTRQLSTLKD